MTKARDTANIVGGGFSGTIAGATMEPTGDTAAGDNAAIGFTSAEGLIITGQGSTNDVTIKNDADADVIEIPTGTVNVTMAGTLGVTGVITGGGLVVPDGSIAVADLDIDGGTDIGAALVDADLMIVDDGAGGTNRKATMARLATYMGTKIGGGLEFISSTDISDGTSTVSFTGFDASKYDSYYFTFHNIRSQDDGVYLRIRSSSDTSSHSYDSGTNEYGISGVVHGSGEGTSANTQGNLFNAIGTGSGEIGISGTLEVFSAHLSINTFFNSFFGGYNSSGNLINQTMTNIRIEDAQVNAVQFFFHQGNFASGTITMYGLVNS